MSILTTPETWPFAAALATLVGLGVIEGLGMLFAASPSLWLDHVLPDLPEGADGVLGWLHWGRVPLLVLLILFLAGFSLAGYVVQSTMLSLLGFALPAWLASVPAIFVGMSTVRGVGGLAARYAPRDETTAVSELSMIGRAGVIARGSAKRGLAAEAKVRDMHGYVHYVMVEPDLDDVTFEEGADIVLVRKISRGFTCIANPHPELL
jgi:hypothetical protein